jgi:hypothetical protein
VQLIDDFYDRFQDMLMDTFDTVLKAMGYKEGLGRGAGAEGPGGPGGGPGGGFGPEGRVAMPQNIKLGMAWLMKEKGLTAEQAGGIMGWMQSESGFNPRAHNDIGGGHTGIMQWDRGRWRNYLENFLPTMQNKDPYDFMNQLKFWWHEQETTEKQYGVIAKLRAAQTALQANYAVHFTERSGNMYQGGRAAQRIAEQYRGGIPDETTTASAGGYPMPVRDIMGRVHAAAMGMHKGIDIVLGDSIGHGIADAIGAPRDAIDGRSPEAIYNSMMTHLEDFRNKNVALASGSNWGWRPEQQEYFRKTVQKLHSVGAHIALVNISGAVHGADQIMAQERAALGKGDWYAPGGLADTDYRHVHPIHGGAGYHRIAQQLIDQSDHSTNNYIIHEAGDPHGTANAVVALKNRHHQRLRHNHIRKLV